MPAPARLLSREVLPFLGSFAALALLALALDGLLHLFDLLWIGRWLGIPGTLLIIGSTAYSLRKRKLIQRGHPARMLRWHEVLAWLGSLLVLVHAGVHFNAILGWSPTVTLARNPTSVAAANEARRNATASGALVPICGLEVGSVRALT